MPEEPGRSTVEGHLFKCDHLPMGGFGLGSAREFRGSALGVAS